MKNKIYPLTNPESVSFNEIAAQLSRILGKEVQYQSPAPAAFESIMKGAGVPDLYIGMFTMWATAQTQGALDLEDDTLSSFLGRRPTTVKQFLSRVYV